MLATNINTVFKLINSATNINTVFKFKLATNINTVFKFKLATKVNTVQVQLFARFLRSILIRSDQPNRWAR